MSGKYLIDTNIVIAIFGGETSVQTQLEHADEIFVPSIVLGELYFGAYKSSRAKENVARVDEFARHNPVLTCDAETASEYGRIKNRLREKGRPIPENDVWLAAIARQHDLILATRDAHFSHVDDLKRQLW